MKSTLVFLGLSAVAFAHTGLKGRLAQQASCTCSIPAGATSTGLPSLSQATYNGFNQGASLSNGATVSTVPDTEILTQGAEECCSCNAGSNSAASSGSKNRHFDILGSITFNETITWGESGNSTYQSSGRADKQSSNAVSNVNGTTSGSPFGNCVTSCGNGTIAL
jgi:hypothetical protein